MAAAPTDARAPSPTPAAARWQSDRLAPGLYLVATPIGTARDITLRALDILASADVLAAEDTRSLRHLMDLHGVPLQGRRILPYHDHNGPRVRPRLLAELGAGRSVAYASEAGTPLIADPGFQLVRAARAAGYPVTSAPGPSAVLAALTLAGLPTDRFLFAGFPPAAAAARMAFLRELATAAATVVLFESPKRINRTFADLEQCFGGGRRMALCRELTKRFEEVMEGTVSDLRRRCAASAPRGEIVLAIDRAGPHDDAAADLSGALCEALGRLSLRDATDEVAQRLGLPRRLVYQAALAKAGRSGADGRETA